MIDLTRITWIHTGLVGLSGAAAYATHLGEPASLALGGLVMGVNFVLLRIIVSTVFSGATDKAPNKALGIGAFILKFTLFLLLLASVFHRLPVEGMSFAFGATLLVVACVVEALRHDASLSKGVV